MEQRPTSDKSPGHAPEKRRKHTLRTILLVLLGVVLLIGAVVVFLGLNLLNKLDRTGSTTFEDENAVTYTPTPSPTATPALTSGPTPSPTPTPIPTPLPLSELYNQTILTQEQLAYMDANLQDSQFIHVLLIGVDRRGSSGNSRADTVMIATIDKKNGRLKLTSLMRDMLVNIPDNGYGKMNRSAAVGGVELLLATINENFHMNLQDYVLVDFNMFEDVIDALGGVTVRMSAEEISAANDCIAGLNKERGIADLWDGFIFAEAGNVKLTGKQALGYARVRKIDSDFSRTNRQFKVLNAVFAKFKDASLTKQYSFLEEILPLVETNMTNARILECATSALSMNTQGLLSYRLPVDDLYENGRYEGSFVFLTDLPANALALHQFIFDAADEPDEAKVLSPGASLPPRTPTIYQGADGNYYYYATGQMVPTPTPDLNSLAGQSFVVNGVTLTVDAAGNLVDAAGNIVYPAGSWTVGQ